MNLKLKIQSLLMRLLDTEVPMTKLAVTATQCYE